MRSKSSAKFQPGCRTKIFCHAARGSKSFSAARELRRSFQKESSLRLAWMQRKARTFSAPGSLQNMPDCLQRFPMMVRQPASMAPEPMKYFFGQERAVLHTEDVADRRLLE
jgi:hypothetical protein